jgi:protein-disulfide isomerase
VDRVVHAMQRGDANDSSMESRLTAKGRWQGRWVAGFSAMLILLPHLMLAAEPGMTARQADDILDELRKIRQLLERSGTVNQSAASIADETASLTTRDSFVLGNPMAPLTLVEFADYQCPYCRRFHTSVFDDIKKNYVDTGKVLYIARDLPLPIHDHASGAANAARCAGEQSQFWAMRHVLIVNAQKLERDDLIAYARDLHLNMPAFTACVQQNKYEAAVQQDAADAEGIGVTGTPTFLLGKTVKSGQFNGIKIVGAQPYQFYDAKIRAMLDSH